MLELRHISKMYSLGLFGRKQLVAVDDVSFKIEPGRIVSLIGESGSGKTTVGRLILRLIKPSSGELIFKGQDIAGLKQNQIKKYYYSVQGIFQDPFSSFNPVYKADRIFSLVHAEFFPSVSNRQWHNKVEKTLWNVGLNPPEVLNKFAHQLSGGQLQRFLIARALLLDVKFLVADEIISMLDASTRIDVLNLLADLRSKGLSILFITHDLNLGYYISDAVLIMHQGVMVEAGETREVFHRPLHPYTQMLLNAVPRLDQKWEAASSSRPILEATFTKKKEKRCKYFERCPIGDDGCLSPPLTQVAANHLVACRKFS